MSQRKIMGALGPAQEEKNEELTSGLIDFIETRDYDKESPLSGKYLAQIKQMFNAAPQQILNTIEKLVQQSMGMNSADYLYYLAEKLPEGEREGLIKNLYDFNPREFRKRFFWTVQGMNDIVRLMPTFRDQIVRATRDDQEIYDRMMQRSEGAVFPLVPEVAPQSAALSLSRRSP